MPNLDSRLLDCAGRPEIEENFNRVHGLIGALEGVAKCDVTFDSDGGSAVTAQSVAYGGTASEPSDPTKESNTFAGWYLGAEQFDFDTVLTAHITLTAHWTAT